jgi:hypothetical protein
MRPHEYVAAGYRSDLYDPDDPIALRRRFSPGLLLSIFDVLLNGFMLAQMSWNCKGNFPFFSLFRQKSAVSAKKHPQAGQLRSMAQKHFYPCAP